MSPSFISTLLGRKKPKTADSALTVDEGIVGCMYAPKLTSLDYNLSDTISSTATSRTNSNHDLGNTSNSKNPNPLNHLNQLGSRMSNKSSRVPMSTTKSDVYSPIYCTDTAPVLEYDYVNPRTRRESGSRCEFDERPLVEKTGGRFTFQKIVKTIILYLVGLLVFKGLILLYILSLTYRQFVKVVLICVYGDRIWLIERPADALWGYETDSSSSNIVYVLKVKGVPDINRIVDDFERKVLKYRTLLRADGNADGIYHMYSPYKKLGWIVRQRLLFYCWERDEDFNVRNHFFMEKVMDEGDNVDERIEAVCEAYLEYKLDPMKPQWEFRVIAPVGAEGSANSDYGLIFCVHHSYGDGISWLQMFRHCLADEAVKLPIDPMKTPLRKPSSRSERFTVLAQLLEKLALYVCLPFRFALQMSRMAQETNAFHGPFVSGTKRCGWTKSTMTLETIKSIRQRNGTNVLFTTVVLSCAAKAFQRSFHHVGAPIPSSLLAGVPYAKLPYKSFEPLNSFTMALFPLPTRILFNRNLRLSLTDKMTREFSSPRHAKTNYILTNMAGSLITPLFKLTTLVAKSSVGMTNLPGPNETVCLFGGHSVNNFIIYAPMKFRTGVNIGVFSYCGKVTLSLAVDSTVTEKHPKFSELFISYLEKEMEVIVKECGVKKVEDVESLNSLGKGRLEEESDNEGDSDSNNNNYTSLDFIKSDKNDCNNNNNNIHNISLDLDKVKEVQHNMDCNNNNEDKCDTESHVKIIITDTDSDSNVSDNNAK